MPGDLTENINVQESHFMSHHKRSLRVDPSSFIMATLAALRGCTYLQQGYTVGHIYHVYPIVV